MNVAILLASGKGTRVNNNKPKQFIKINNKMIFNYTLDTFLSIAEIDLILLVLPHFYVEKINKEINNKKVHVIEGGKTRGESTYLSLKYLKDYLKDDDIVLIHDAVRPLISKKIILDNIEATKKYKAAVTCLPLVDSLLKGKEYVDFEMERNNLFLVQTPQSFFYREILNAYEKEKDFLLSDDVSVYLKENKKVYIVKGSRFNFKITSGEDLILFDMLKDIQFKN